jgi:glycosyltransferase involved in cell wall biosynthesis
MDISIIIPTYNRLWCLEKAICSCKKTNLDTEIIIIDDGSTDGTADWLKKQHGLNVITQANLGKDWAVNKGLSIASGKYIRFLDSDDWLLPYSSDDLFEKAEAEVLDVVAAGHQVFSEKEELFEDRPWIVCTDFLAQQLGECDSSHYSAYLFKKAFIQSIPHRQEYGSRDDRKFIIEVALRNPRTGFINIPTFVHRAHEKERLQRAEGITNCINHLAVVNIYKKALEVLEAEGRNCIKYNKIVAKMLWPVAHWIAKTHLQEAIKLYDWIKELDPELEIPEKGYIGFMYRYLGFSTTEKFFFIIRLFKYGFN